MSWSRAPLPDNLTAQTDWPDLLLLACSVLGEAESESWQGKLAVAWVVVNRAEDSRERWPRMIGRVCLQKRQFSCWSDPRRLNVMRSPKLHTTPEVWESCFRAACGAMFNLAPSIIGGSNHYLTTRLAETDPPAWYDPDRVTVKLGGHTFLAL